MTATIQTVAIVGKHWDVDSVAVISTAIEICRRKWLRTIVETETARAIEPRAESADFDVIGREADLLIVVGGDGMLLKASRMAAAFDLPIVGINRGRLGFLTHIDKTNLRESLTAILNGQGTEDRRILLEAMITRENGETIDAQVAMNDITISRGSAGRMIEFEIAVDNEFVYRQRADGLVVSTPTGSTAYALSANGPIMHPSCQSIALVPLSPHSLSCRPITIPDHARIDCRLIAAIDAYVHYDGQIQVPLSDGDIVSISRSSDHVRLLVPPNHCYFGMLRDKLHWSESPVEWPETAFNLCGVPPNKRS